MNDLDRTTSTSPSGGPSVLFCTVCDDRFLVGALVMLRSLMDRVRCFAGHRLKIFHDDQISLLSRESQARILEVAPHAEFEPIANETYRRANVRHESHRAAYLTLEAFRQSGFDRVVFFDVDMLCLGDFSDVLTGGADFKACRGGPYRVDDKITRWGGPHPPAVGLPTRAIRRIKRRLGWSDPAHDHIIINTGFMVIGNRYLGEATHRAMNEAILAREEPAHQLDQFIVNGHFQERYVPIQLVPQTYNFRDWGGGGNGSNELFESLLDQIKIIHYSGYGSRPKPWNPNASSDVTAVRTWREFAHERFGRDFLLEAAVAGKASA